MILYGRNPVREALRAGRRQMGEIWATERVLAREPWLGQAGARITSAHEIERRADSPDHQGVCAEAGGYPYVSGAELLMRADPFIVALDELQDPQNLGAIARSAECAGVSGLVICERRAAAVTPAVAKASAGAVEHLRIARVRNMADFLGQAKDGRGVVLRRRRRGRDRVRRAGLHRRRRARHGRRGSGSAPARGEGLRRARGAAAARPHGVAERERRGGHSHVRDLAAPLRGLTGLHNHGYSGLRVRVNLR